MKFPVFWRGKAGPGGGKAWQRGVVVRAALRQDCLARARRAAGPRASLGRAKTSAYVVIRIIAISDEEAFTASPSRSGSGIRGHHTELLAQ